MPALTSAWVQATVRIDRTAPTDPDREPVARRWQNVASVTVSASGSTDALSGVAGYQYEHLDQRMTARPGRRPPNAGSVTISAEGETLVQFRAARQCQQRLRLGADVGAASIAPRRPDPTVAGGSAVWQSVASVMVSASGSTDTLSGLLGYEYQTSTDNGATWSASTSGAATTISAEGQTLVRFRSIDNVALTSAWVQATVRIDRTAPTDPTVAGGSAVWQNVASVTVSASGSTDTPGSGLAGYSYRTSTNAGATWSAVTNAGSVAISAQLQTLVQFRARDNASNVSGWVQTSVWLDRTAPTNPTVAGGSAVWQSVASVIVPGERLDGYAVGALGLRVPDLD